MQPQKKIILISLVTGILLMVAKFVAFFVTSSNSILTDASESIVNVLASSFAFYSIYLSALPRDQNHPYGHGKVEFFAVFIEGVLITLAGVLIMVKSVYNLVHPQMIYSLLDGTLIIAATGVVNFGLGTYMVRQSKTLNSLTLYADGKHLLTDAYSSAALVGGLILIYATGIYYLDSILSIGLGVFILYHGYKLVRRSVGGLMDESDLEKVSQVVGILNDNRKDSWIDVHNLRTQIYGADLHIDCHLTLPYYFDLTKVHEEVTEVSRLINAKSRTSTELFIHADPCLPECCHYCRMQDCPVRNEVKRKDITWTLANVTLNQKHFE